MHAMWRRHGALAMALAAAALAVPGCGGDDDDGGNSGGVGGGSESEDKNLTAEQVSSLEEKIKTRLSDSPGTSTDLSSRPSVESVECPEDIPAEKGAKFDCTASTSLGDQTVKVELLSEDGQSYKYETSSP